MGQYNNRDGKILIGGLLFLTIAVVGLLFSSGVFAQSLTPVSVKQYNSAGLWEISYALNMDSGGLGGLSTTQPISGKLKCVITNPGTTAPSDNWDLTINDADGVDVMGTATQNRDTATSERAYPLTGSGGTVLVDGAPVCSVLTFVYGGNSVANATSIIRLIVEKKK